jgi:Taurine catabolism dioxygenase TauD, TfdA family
VILNVDPGPLQRIAGDPEMGLDPLTPAQLNALDIVLNLAQKHHVAVNMQPGDILFVNNLSNMHSREPFEDKGRRKRHLLRLWLYNENLGWKIPNELQSSWDAIYANCSEMVDMVFPVEPKAYYKPPRISTTTASAYLVPDEYDSDRGSDLDSYDSTRN